MTAIQTPADIKLLPLPRSLFDASVDLAASYNGVKSVERAALRDRLYDEVKAYALACVEADRKERANANPIAHYASLPEASLRR